MLALAIPLYLFYELAIVFGWLYNRRKAQASPQGGSGRRRGMTTEAFELDRFQREGIAAIDRGESVLVVGAHRVGQDGGGRARRGPGPGRRAARPSTPRPSRPCRTRSTTTWWRATAPSAVGPAHRRQRDQRRRPGRGDDHRGAAQHDLQPVARARRARLGGARRGPLPPGRLPRTGVGGGHHPPAHRRCAWCACRPRCRTRAELAAWIGTVRGPTATVVETERPDRAGQPVHGGRPGRAPTRCSSPPWSTAGPTPTASASTWSRARWPGRGRPRRRWFTPRRIEVVDQLRGPATCCRPSTSSSAGPPATTRSAACLDAGVRLIDLDAAGPHRPRSSSSTWPACPTRPRRCSATAGSAPASTPGWPPTTPAWCRRSRRRSSAASSRGWSGWCSPPRRWRWASTCRPARVVIEKLTKFTGERHEFLSPGPVHPAHRSGRAPGHRHHRPRRGAVVALRLLRRGGRPGRQPQLRAHLVVPSDLQHGGQPGAALPGRRRRTTCSTCPSPSSRPTRRSCTSRPGWPGARPP